jgi:prevent-host-death family protein
MARSRLQKEAGSSSVSATDAQNNFGEVLTRVARDGRVFITRYRRPEAVVLSMEEYEALIGQEPVDLGALEREFESMVAQMQSPGQRAATDALFGMSGLDLGKAAARIRERK